MGRMIGFITFPGVLAQREMHSVSAGFRGSISHGKRYTIIIISIQ